MNSSEQKDFEHVLPANEEIQETISFITQKLNTPEMKLVENEAVRKGYMEAIDILANDKKNYDQIAKDLHVPQSMAIAILAVNYLNGECSQKVLLGFK